MMLLAWQCPCLRNKGLIESINRGPLPLESLLNCPVGRFMSKELLAYAEQDYLE